MSDKPVIQIDDDWKRQAQEEKRKLAEKQAAEKESALKKAAPPASTASPAAASAAWRMPEANFGTLVQSIMTQALYAMGELAGESEQPAVNLDVAKHHIDTLAVIDSKTRNNLSPPEQSLIDQAMYDVRSRFVAIASQMIR